MVERPMFSCLATRGDDMRGEGREEGRPGQGEGQGTGAEERRELKRRQGQEWRWERVAGGGKGRGNETLEFELKNLALPFRNQRHLPPS